MNATASHAQLDLDHQCGVLTFRQAIQTMTESRIRAELEAKRWQRPCINVLVTHNGPLTVEQRPWVALLHAPAGSVLSGSTAAALDGLAGSSLRSST